MFDQWLVEILLFYVFEMFARDPTDSTRLDSTDYSLSRHLCMDVFTRISAFHSSVKFQYLHVRFNTISTSIYTISPGKQFKKTLNFQNTSILNLEWKIINDKVIFEYVSYCFPFSCDQRRLNTPIIAIE